tara:strand:- start:118 stop:564 length:447 start_codon:yes stop_codon:yes gene_type:complete
MLTNHLVEKIKEYYDLKIKDHEVCYWGESLGEEIKKLAFIPSSDAHIGAISSIARAFREKKYRENSEYKKYKNSWDSLNEVFYFRNRWLVDLYYERRDILYFIRIIYVKMLVVEGWLDIIAEKGNDAFPLFFEEYEERLKLVFRKNII